MPLDILRLNAKKTLPNNRIVFIKPLKGKDEAIAQDFLERIAAQCVPIMKEHRLSLTTLEEYELNREFVGRNFNGGEIIQLVLKSRSGHWLPFNYVQMVMMHELAHCVQMNHSRAFWKVRNLYAEQMRTLWASAYTGEGMWGRGALLGSGEFEKSTVAEGDDLPEHLCGGTYRSRRRKRKGGAQELSYQEKKQRRIEKKFGKNGVALGADDGVKAKLEKGKRTQAAPRVAGSNRGRELRAAAALARFEEKKEEPKQEESDESGYEDAEDADFGADDALDIDGKTLRDTKGNRMVRVCEDENPDDEDAANELQELQLSMRAFLSPTKRKNGEARTESDASSSSNSRASRHPRAQTRDKEIKLEAGDVAVPHKLAVGVQSASRAGQISTNAPVPNKSKPAPVTTTPAASDTAPDPVKKGASCPVCSFENEAYIVTCGMCSNVLDPDSVPGSWSCQSSTCKDGIFLNAGDCGTCGVCGQRKCTEKSEE